VSRPRRFARLLRILASVIQTPGQSPAQLAGRLDVSERTLFRDLNTLRRFGIELRYQDGYQLQERLDLEARAPRLGSLPAVYDQQLKLLRAELPARLAAKVEEDVSARAPAALAALFAAAIERQLASPR